MFTKHTTAREKKNNYRIRIVSENDIIRIADSAKPHHSTSLRKDTTTSKRITHAEVLTQPRENIFIHNQNIRIQLGHPAARNAGREEEEEKKASRRWLYTNVGQGLHNFFLLALRAHVHHHIYIYTCASFSISPQNCVNKCTKPRKNEGGRREKEPQFAMPEAELKLCRGSRAARVWNVNQTFWFLFQGLRRVIRDCVSICELALCEYSMPKVFNSRKCRVPACMQCIRLLFSLCVCATRRVC